MMFFTINMAYAAMIAIVSASNFLVQFPINAWLTWGGMPYPLSFLVTELTNCFYGPKTARRVVYVGFALGVFFSIWVATPKIAFASGSAFLLSQLLDITIFNRLRRMTWWYAPFFASFFGSIVDTVAFWSIAFFGEDVPLLTWIMGDFIVKLIADIVMLTPFRMAIRRAAGMQPVIST